MALLLLIACLGSMGSGTTSVQRLIALGQWAMAVLPLTASLSCGSGPCNAFCSPPCCFQAMGNVTNNYAHSLIVLGQWVVELLLFRASLPRGCGQWNSLCSLPHHIGEAANGTPPLHRLTGMGQWAQELFMYTTTLR